jgi:hypothetical protein
MIQLRTPILVDIILNHPDVRPTMEKGDHAISVEPLLDGKNVAYANDSTVVLFLNKGAGRYEGHIASMPHGRGAATLKAGKEALDRLFTDHRAAAVEAAIPLELREARMLVRRLGFASLGIRKDKPVEDFIMEAASWAA